MSVCNGNQSTSYPARSQHEWPWREIQLPIHSFIGKENTSIKNTWPFMRLIEVEEKARVLEEQARIQ